MSIKTIHCLQLHDLCVPDVTYASTHPCEDAMPLVRLLIYFEELYATTIADQ